MFKNSATRSRTPAQAARVAFGLVLVAGAARVVCIAHAASHAAVTGSATAVALGHAWLAATAAAVATYAILRILPQVREREHIREASFVLPAIGAALVLPLSVHALWKLASGAGLHDFDEWAWLSIVFTGLAHVVFAISAAVRASQLARGKPPIHTGMIYAITIAAGMFPFPVLPSIYIALTGIPILPLVYAMKPLAARERARRGAELPVAIVRDT